MTDLRASTARLEPAQAAAAASSSAAVASSSLSSSPLSKLRQRLVNELDVYCTAVMRRAQGCVDCVMRELEHAGLREAAIVDLGFKGPELVEERKTMLALMLTPVILSGWRAMPSPHRRLSEYVGLFSTYFEFLLMPMLAGSGFEARLSIEEPVDKQKPARTAADYAGVLASPSGMSEAELVALAASDAALPLNDVPRDTWVLALTFAYSPVDNVDDSAAAADTTKSTTL